MVDDSGIDLTDPGDGGFDAGSAEKLGKFYADVFARQLLKPFFPEDCAEQLNVSEDFEGYYELSDTCKEQIDGYTFQYRSSALAKAMHEYLSLAPLDAGVLQQYHDDPTSKELAQDIYEVLWEATWDHDYSKNHPLRENGRSVIHDQRLAPMKEAYFKQESELDDYFGRRFLNQLLQTDPETYHQISQQWNEIENTLAGGPDEKTRGRLLAKRAQLIAIVEAEIEETAVERQQISFVDAAHQMPAGMHGLQSSILANTEPGLDQMRKRQRRLRHFVKRMQREDGNPDQHER